MVGAVGEVGAGDEQPDQLGRRVLVSPYALVVPLAVGAPNGVDGSQRLLVDELVELNAPRWIGQDFLEFGHSGRFGL